MLFLVFLIIIFSIPAVQTRIAKIVTDNINEDYGTDLVIKKVDLSLLGTVALKGVEIRDHHKDTLIFVDRIRTSLLNAKRILDNKVELKNTSFKGIHFHMKTYKDEDNDNLSIFVDKFEDDNPRDTTLVYTPFELSTSNIYLEDLTYTLIDENNKVPLDFAAYGGGGTLQDFSIVGPNVSVKIRGLYFTDNRGVDITSLTTDFKYTKAQMQFYDTRIETPHSLLNAQLEFNYRRSNLSKFNELVTVDATFDKSYLSILDLKKLYNELNGNDVLHFTTNLHGSLNNFSAKDLKLYSDKGIKIDGDLNFINAVSQEDFFLTADLNNVTADYYRLKDILPNLLGKTLPTEFKKLGKFHLSGFTKVTPNAIEATLDIDSEIGMIISDLEITDFADIDDATYSGDIEFIKFDLGRIFEDPLFGKFSFKGEIPQGKGFRVENINTTLIGDISEIEYNKYVYQDIHLNGTYKNNVFDGNFIAKDANLKMNFDGLADFSKDVSQFDFLADISYVDLKATNLYLRDSISELQGTINFNFKGNQIDNIVGFANFKNIKYKNQKEEYSFKQFLVFSKKENDIREILINSEDIVKGELTGKFAFKDLYPITLNALGSIYTNFTPYKVDAGQYLDFDFTVYNQIVEVFYPEISIAPNTKLKGEINADDSHLKLDFNSPKVTIYENVIDSLLLDIDNKSRSKFRPYVTELKAKKIETPYYSFSKVLLFNKTINDTLYFKSGFRGGELEREKFNLDFYYTINEDKKSVVGIEKSTFNFKEDNWVINEENNKAHKLTFDLNKDEYVFSPLELKSIKKNVRLKGVLKDQVVQGIKFQGVLRDSTYKDLHAEFTNVYLESFLPPVDSLSLKGQLNGNIDFVQKDGLYDPKGELKVNDFHINDFKQGDLSLAVKGKNSYETYTVNFYIGTENAKSISVKEGTIDFSSTRPTIDFDAVIKGFKLNAFSPLGEDVVSKLRGTATGDFKLKGFLRNPEMKGKLVLKDAGLQFPYLNVDYNFDGETSVRLGGLEKGTFGRSFIFEDIALKDTKYDTKGVLNGDITHQNFDQWSLNLEIESDNLLVLDTEDSEEALYYGTGFIEGNAGIYGLTNSITIDVQAKTMPGTLFVIPIKDIASIDYYRLIRFRSKNKTEDLEQKTAAESIEGVDLNIDLEVTKDAEAQVVIDEVNGSELKGRGTGNLNIEINTRGKFIMDGDFTIDQGVYNFKYGGVINKPFEILKGGTISWNGNPYEANLNVTAVYTTQANPAVLLENFNTSRKIPVNLVTKITGGLFNSTQEFDIQIPNSNSTIASELDFVLNDNDVNAKMQQFFSLLATGSFRNPNRANIDGGELLTGTTTNVIGAILSDIISSEKFQFQLDYTSGDPSNPQDDLLTDDQVGVSVRTKLTDRVIINGKVGVPVGAQTQSSVVGEVKVEVLLNESGSFRGVIFNRQNEIQYSAQEEGYTQGIGLSYQVNFNSLSDLLQKMGLKKKGKKKKEEKKKKKKDTIVKPYKLLRFNKN
ncbi:MAG: translocation/assembly module TamB [Flavobacteriaceae bacterium]